MNHHPRRISRSYDNSPDAHKRPRHDNNNTEQLSHMPPQGNLPHDFSTKHHQHSIMNNQSLNSSIMGNPIMNNQHSADGGNNGNNNNGVSNSSGSPSPGLMDDVKNEPMELLCGVATDLDRSDDSPPSHQRPHVRFRNVIMPFLFFLVLRFL